jgi:DNA-3-methyladenine glycosylase
MYIKLKKDFFSKTADIAAKDILGKTLVRKIDNKEFRAKIVETEAYFSDWDPASRACKNGDLKDTMEMRPGTILVYGVHNNWLLNLVTDKEGEASAILIRALEPLNFDNNCSGPGRLTKAIKIGKEFHKKNIFNCHDFWLEEPEKKKNFEVDSSYRIGIKKDLELPFRFYINKNKFVSRK